jgi:hypothetical protein
LLSFLLPQTEDTAWIITALKDFVGRVDALDNYLGYQHSRGKLYPGVDVSGSP